MQQPQSFLGYPAAQVPRFFKNSFKKNDPKPTSTSACIHTTRSCPAISHYQLGYLRQGQDVEIFQKIYGNAAPRLVVINRLRSRTIRDGRPFSWLWWRPTREVLKGRLVHIICRLASSWVCIYKLISLVCQLISDAFVHIYIYTHTLGVSPALGAGRKVSRRV